MFGQVTLKTELGNFDSFFNLQQQTFKTFLPGLGYLQVQWDVPHSQEMAQAFVTGFPYSLIVTIVMVHSDECIMC
jgi:hypothetical protein